MVGIMVSVYGRIAPTLLLLTAITVKAEEKLNMWVWLT